MEPKEGTIQSVLLLERKFWEFEVERTPYLQKMKNSNSSECLKYEQNVTKLYLIVAFATNLNPVAIVSTHFCDKIEQEVRLHFFKTPHHQRAGRQLGREQQPRAQATAAVVRGMLGAAAADSSKMQAHRLPRPKNATEQHTKYSFAY